MGDIKKIKLLGKTYDVILANLDECEAEINFESLQIFVHNMAEENVAEAILHEIIHAIDDALELKLGETGVNQMSNVMFSFLMDNPEFLKKILSLYKKTLAE
jgi:hypothetical protein